MLFWSFLLLRIATNRKEAHRFLRCFSGAPEKMYQEVRNEPKVRNHLKKSLLNIKCIFVQWKRNLGDTNIKRIINVCFLRKAFVSNQSLRRMKCMGGDENYKRVMNCKIKTKAKSSAGCRTLRASLRGGLPFLSLSAWKLYPSQAANISFGRPHLSTWEEILGVKNERPAFAVMPSSLRLHSESLQNMCLPLTLENKEQLPCWSCAVT